MIHELPLILLIVHAAKHTCYFLSAVVLETSLKIVVNANWCCSAINIDFEEKKSFNPLSLPHNKNCQKMSQKEIKTCFLFLRCLPKQKWSLFHKKDFTRLFFGQRHILLKLSFFKAWIIIIDWKIQRICSCPVRLFTYYWLKKMTRKYDSSKIIHWNTFFEYLFFGIPCSSLAKYKTLAMSMKHIREVSHYKSLHDQVYSPS